MITTPDPRYWIALSVLPDIGPVISRKLLSLFKTPERIFGAEIDDLISLEGIGIHRAKSIKGFALWDIVDRQVRALEKMDINIISFYDHSYPEMLRETEDAPIVLYAKGDMNSYDKYAIAIVGSRKPSPYGTSIAESISEELASVGFTIVSGLSRGIDSISHRGGH